MLYPTRVEDLNQMVVEEECQTLEVEETDDYSAWNMDFLLRMYFLSGEKEEF